MPNEEVMLKDLPVGAQIQPRVAKALSGLEVAEAISKQVGEVVALAGLGEKALKLAEEAHKKLMLDSRLNKEHLTYPKVSWTGFVSVMEGGKTLAFEVRIWQNSIPTNFFEVKWIPLLPHEIVPVDLTLTFDQRPTDRPDEIRRRFKLPLKATATMPGTGQTIMVILPGDTVMSEGGHPTAAAKRMAELRAQHVAQQPRTAPPSPQGGVPASELVAEPPVPGASQSGAPGSIAKPVPRAALGKPKR